jgi:NAD(P)-dependent dehydrogenase (short-subunit alcohol dehydrogenase family)
MKRHDKIAIASVNRALCFGVSMLLAALAYGAVASGSPGDSRKASEAPEAPAGNADVGDRQVVLITGSTDGLGREVARRMAADGAHIIVHGRNRERGEALVREIEEAGFGSARFYASDLASLDAVRQFAADILRDYDRLDVLVNNAGISLRDAERRLSDDGHELAFQVNYLSHFLLTHELLPLIKNSAPARIVNVSSGAQTPIDFDDPMMEQNYNGRRGYAQSKLAQILFTFDLAEALEGTGVIVNSLHPATLMDTTMVLSGGIEPRSSVEEGTDAVMNLIIAPDIGSGQYFNGKEPARANAQAYDAAARAKLRDLSKELTDRR